MKSEKKKVHRAWAFYDWANSAYSLVISTAIFPIYYSEVTKSSENAIISVFGFNVHSAVIYTVVIGLSFLTVSLISPYLGALADVSGRKKRYMRNFVILGSLSCMSLYFFDAEHIEVGLIAAYFASIGFSGSLVFYNAYLPHIAEPEEQDKLSAKGFALGYAGSSLLLISLLVFIEMYDSFGLADKGVASRWAFVSVGVWWLLWTIYPLRHLPSNVFNKQVEPGWSKRAYSELIQVFKMFTRTPRLGRFVASFFFFSCGVQSVILLATLFGKEVLAIDTSQLIITVIIIQFLGIVGAWGFAALSSKLGNIKSIAVAVGIWILVCVSAYLVQTTVQFMIIGGLVGLVMGGIQALARSTYSKMLPHTEDHTTFFSFYDVAEKMATALGMFAIGYVEYASGDPRNWALALIAFFVISLFFLFIIPKSKYVY